MIYTTGTIAINGNTVTGTGTNFSEPLSLIRVGCTLIAIGNPVQIFTITEIKSGTELSVTPAANPAIPAGTKFSILLSDSISVDGLAQDVAETLRYYQGKETEIAAAVEWWKDFGGDGQMDQLLANIRTETEQSTANAQKTESDKNAASASKTAAANSATAAKASQDAAKASETASSNSKTAAATSETNAAKSAADALNYRNQAQGIVGADIGLGTSPRDCPDISGDPSGYIGFMRILERANGFPSIASGEAYLTGFISVCDGSPTYTGIFQGWVTRSLYTYRWSSDIGPQWTGIILPPNELGVSESSDWNAQITDIVAKFKPIEGVTNSPESGTNYCGFHAQFAGRYATQFAGRNSKFYARSFEAGVDKGWRRLATLNDNLVQRWTGYQEFKSTDFYSDAFDRKLCLVTRSSAARNMALELWGSDTRPTVLECKVSKGSEGAAKYAFYAQQNTDESIVLNVNGAVTCVTVNQSSDRDLKDNIQVIGDATEAIRKMNGYTYTLKENGLPYAGVIAQEVMEALPEAVGSFTHYGEALQGPTIDGNELREETRYLNVDYAAVTGLLVQVARETDNRVTELEEENASLRANIAVMDERITKLEALVRQLTGSEE